MPTKCLYCEEGDIISYGASKYLVVKVFDNGSPKELMTVKDGNTFRADSPSTWRDIPWEMVTKKSGTHKYWQICTKIKQMDAKRKEMGYAF